MIRTPRALAQMAFADFLERTRRYSFLVTLLGTLFFGYLVITGKYAIRLGDYRGEYNSAWVGSLMASGTAIMMGFFGFYLVKNSLGRDRRSGVGEIIASTSLGNTAYLATKFFSNFAVLCCITLVLVSAAAVMQLLGRVHDGFDPWALVAPFLFVCPPLLALVSATALLFESVKFLRGTFGNVLYFFIAEAAFMTGIFLRIPWLDLSGLGSFIPSMERAALAAYPGADLGIEVGFVGFVKSEAESTMRLFRWDGLDWSLAVISLRLLWAAAAACIVGVAAVRFDRFDPASEGRIRKKRRGKRPTRPAVEAAQGGAPTIEWGRIIPVELSFSFFNMLKAELRLMLKGYHWAWYAIAAGFIAAQLALPYEHARSLALPAAWIWPLAIWSAMGTRETRFNTDQLLFSSPFPVSRQFPVVWLAGLTIAMLTGSGMIVRAALAGNTSHLYILIAGALFVTSFALVVGTLSGTKKLFEVVYLLIWYIGPINQLPQLDFLGSTVAATSQRTAVTFSAISLAFVAIAFAVRRRQVATGRY